MHLPGQLKSSTLGDLLGALHRQRTTGSLELTETASGRHHRIHLVMGLVTAVETSAHVPPIGEILRREGYVDAGAIERMLRRLAAGDTRPAGEILVGEGLIADDALQAGLRAQLRARLEELFQLGDAAIRFHAAKRDRASRFGPLAPSDFLHGRPRARDRQKADAGRGAHRNSAADAPRARSSGEARVHASTDPARAHAMRLLGLRGGETPADVRRAFRRLAAEIHPDRAAPDARSACAASFAKLSAAYHLLVA
jgi:hypothetical protein